MTRSAQKPLRGWVVLNLVLVLAIVSTAVSIVGASHHCRQAYARLAALQTGQWNMQEQWGKLLLEQSTWAAHHRVEQLARRELGMRLPKAAELDVVAP
ncbi:MAG: cell division protein FtsL [Halieaceae bacterium]|jgi:cell division protein FtsL|nr:cell division protein FtsL [Halieaceae bacterium]